MKASTRTVAGKTIQACYPDPAYSFSFQTVRETKDKVGGWFVFIHCKDETEQDGERFVKKVFIEKSIY